MIGDILICLVLAFDAFMVGLAVVESGFFRGATSHLEEDAELYEQHRRMTLDD